MEIKWNPAGFDEILRSAPVAARVERETMMRGRLAGAGYYAGVRQGRSRVRGIVYAESWAALEDQAKNNTLLRVLG